MLSPLDPLILALKPLSALSDADALAALNTSILTALDLVKPGYVVTYTTIASKWTAATAAGFISGIKAGAAQTGNPQFAALCILADAILGGAGLLPSDPQSVVAATAFVQAGLATQDQLDGLFYRISYPADGPFALADVTAARAWITRQAAIVPITLALQSFIGTAMNETLTAAADPANPLPTAASLIAAFTASLTANGVA